jgi:hypothetical protein
MQHVSTVAASLHPPANQAKGNDFGGSPVYVNYDRVDRDQCFCWPFQNRLELVDAVFGKIRYPDVRAVESYTGSFISGPDAEQNLAVTRPQLRNIGESRFPNIHPVEDQATRIVRAREGPQVSPVARSQLGYRSCGKYRFTAESDCPVHCQSLHYFRRVHPW